MEPSKRWLLWVRWLAIMAVVAVVIPLFISTFKDNASLKWAAIALDAAIVVMYRPLKQRVDLAYNGATISLALSMNILGHILMRVRGSPDSRKIRLGSYSGAPVWFEPTVEIAGQARRLLIFFRFPQGFMVSHGSDGSPIATARNEICL